MNSKLMKAYSDLRKAFQATIFSDRWVNGKTLTAKHYNYYLTWLEWIWKKRIPTFSLIKDFENSITAVDFLLRSEVL
jgi:hypothetical protein